MTVHYASAVLLGPGSKPKWGPTLVKQEHCRHGSMIYFPHDKFIGKSLEKYGEYVEAETEFLLRGIPIGGIVVEVGANIGCHTVPIAKHVGMEGHVLAFEPQRIIHQMLCGNLAVNGLFNVTAERFGLGEKMGMMHIPPIDYAEEYNFGGVALCDAGEPVNVLTLDFYKASRVDMIKIDVEGMELSVLKGAEDTIKRCRPLIYVENDRDENKAALIAHLRALGYDLYWHIPPLFNPQNYRENPENIFLNVASINMACVPHERAEQVKVDGLPKVLE